MSGVCKKTLQNDTEKFVTVTWQNENPLNVPKGCCALVLLRHRCCDAAVVVVSDVFADHLKQQLN